MATSPGPGRSTREEGAHVRCGIGSWGGRCLSLVDYVTGTEATKGATAPPEALSVGYPPILSSDVDYPPPRCWMKCERVMLPPKSIASRPSRVWSARLRADCSIWFSAERGPRATGAPWCPGSRARRSVPFDHAYGLWQDPPHDDMNVVRAVA